MYLLDSSRLALGPADDPELKGGGRRFCEADLIFQDRWLGGGPYGGGRVRPLSPQANRSPPDHGGFRGPAP